MSSTYPAHLGYAHLKYLLWSVSIFVSLSFLPVRVIDVINWPLVQETFSYTKAFLKRNRLYSNKSPPDEGLLDSVLSWISNASETTEDRVNEGMWQNAWRKCPGCRYVEFMSILSHQFFANDHVPLCRLNPGGVKWCTVQPQTLLVTIDEWLSHAANGPVFVFTKKTCRHITAALINTHSWIQPSHIHHVV